MNGKRFKLVNALCVAFLMLSFAVIPANANSEKSTNSIVVALAPGCERDIAYGQTYSTDLNPSAQYRIFCFNGKKGDKITITLSPSTSNSKKKLDPYLVLNNPNGNRIGYDNPSGKGKTAQIVHNSLPNDGVYIIIAGSDYKVPSGDSWGIQIKLSKR
jgi:hypothetical protein